MILAHCLVCSMNAQTYWSKRYDLDRGNDYGTSVIITLQGDILVQVKGFCEINMRECDGILRLDTDGHLLARMIVYDTLDAEHIQGMFYFNDTVYYNLTYYSATDLQYTVLLFDLEGNELGRHDYYHPTQNVAWSRSITGNAETIFVNFAYRDTLTGRGREKARAYDRSWNVLWEAEMFNTYPMPLWCETQATPDGGLVAVYSSWSIEDYNPRICTIEKYDVDGKMEWQTILSGWGKFSSSLVRIDNHPDGGYVGLWHKDSTNLFTSEIPVVVFKLDAEGNIEWERFNLYEQFRLYDVFATRSGKIIGCGYAEQWPWDHELEIYVSTFLICFDAAGERLWERNIFEENLGTRQHELYAGAELPNGDLVFTGLLSDTIWGTPDDPTPDNVWVVKVDSMGCFEPGCDEWQTVAIKDHQRKEKKEQSFVAYPNPASDYVVLGAVLGAHIRPGAYTLLLHDMQGHLLSRQQFDPLRITQIDTRHLASGQYVITVLRDGIHEQTLMVVRL